jgi:predicted nucleic acid-binding protein
MRYLFDASSVLKAVKQRKVKVLDGQAVQWLTVYEVLNAVWKEAALLKRISFEEAAQLVEVLSEIFRYVTILDPSGFASLYACL